MALPALAVPDAMSVPVLEVPAAMAVPALTVPGTMALPALAVPAVPHADLVSDWQPQSQFRALTRPDMSVDPAPGRPASPRDLARPHLSTLDTPALDTRNMEAIREHMQATRYRQEALRLDPVAPDNLNQQDVFSRSFREHWNALRTHFPALTATVLDFAAHFHNRNNP